MAIKIEGAYREYMKGRIKLIHLLTPDKQEEWLDSYYDRLADEVVSWGYSPQEAAKVVEWFDDDYWGLNDPPFCNMEGMDT